jgi:hypothetical protein
LIAENPNFLGEGSAHIVGKNIYFFGGGNLNKEVKGTVQRLATDLNCPASCNYPDKG